MAQHPTEPAAEQTRPEALASAMALPSGRAVGSPLLNRRRALQGLVMGTAGLALSPLTMGQVEIPPGQVRLMFNDCLLYTSPSPRDRQKSRMPSSA